MGFIIGLALGAAAGYIYAKHPDWFKLGGE